MLKNAPFKSSRFPLLDNITGLGRIGGGPETHCPINERYGDFSPVTTCGQSQPLTKSTPAR
jgi:hypothetical protein